MKQAAAALLLSLMVAPAFAAKNCDELKKEITAKIEAKGVKKFDLSVVPSADVKDQKVVGTCDSGKSKIVYKKN